MIVVADLFIAEESRSAFAVTLVNACALVLYRVLFIYLGIVLVLDWIIFELGLDV